MNQRCLGACLNNGRADCMVNDLGRHWKVPSSPERCTDLSAGIAEDTVGAKLRGFTWESRREVQDAASAESEKMSQMCGACISDAAIRLADLELLKSLEVGLRFCVTAMLSANEFRVDGTQGRWLTS